MDSVSLFTNAAETAVTDALEGLLLVSPHLRALDGFPGIKVIVRAAVPAGHHVALISGGGSGHEPSHAGLVADGMLTAAVCGDVFASPSVPAILAAIRHCAASNGGAGALLIVKNYTGDRLAFGLAAEKAKTEGIPVALVVVADDVALEGGPTVGRRGLAGTVLVHKIAGCVAATGAPLSVVAATAAAVAGAVHTMGVSLVPCAVPAPGTAGIGKRPTRIAAGTAEWGLGIHNEAGHSVAPAATARETMDKLLQACSDALLARAAAAASAPVRVVALLNNLGGVSGLEMSVLAASLHDAIADKAPRLQLARLIVAPLMTSLDGKGVSLTLLNADVALPSGAGCSSVLEALDAPTPCPAWPAAYGGKGGTPFTTAKLPLPAPPAADATAAAAAAASTGSASGTIITVSHDTAVAYAAAIATALARVAEEVSRLDAVAGDGDAGQTAATMGKLIAAAVQALPGPRVSLAALFSAAADAVAGGAGGSSGVIVSLMLQGAAAAVVALQQQQSGPEPSAVAACGQAMQAACDAASRYGGARPGDRTLLDSLYPAAAAWISTSSTGNSTTDVLAAASVAAGKGAEASATMEPRVGRASYVGSRVIGNQDAGAFAAAAALAAAATVAAHLTSSPSQ